MPTDPKRLQDLFFRLSQLAAADRFAAFQQTGATDPALWFRLCELLQAHDAPGSSLGLPVPEPDFESGVSTSATPCEPGSDATYVPAVGDGSDCDSRFPTHALDPSEHPSDSAEAEGAHEPLGAVVGGRYVLQYKLGEGGMGEVWVARQIEPVKREVALKLIRPGFDSKGVLQRFEHERQALALMDHPHIARVFDGGMTETGQPYFVMERVPGKPLTRFCDEQKLGIRERLELFVPICQAVQHAHQKGIIHRDLKPANILVTLVDGRPVPKVIDFGVAKATAGKLTEETLATQAGMVVGTLEYMAPEQAGYTTDDIDTRADLYSLGVILYELLTGLRPFDAKRLKQGALHEMIRVIREEDPSKPSTRLSTAESLPSLAALRQTEPRRLMAMMRGELDWVVMKCLEKQRSRRYETANGLARDIQRYLAHEPVEARPPSTGYRLGKFLQRNRGAALATGVVLLALLGGIAGTTWGLLRAREARDAEASRVTERDDALKVSRETLQERNEALRVSEERRTQLIYQRGIDEFLLASHALDSGNAPQAIEHLLQVPEDQRGWEWQYLYGQLQGLFTLYSHTGLVRSVAFSGDGLRIATASDDRTVRLWDARDGTLQMTLKGHDNRVLCVAFSPDGNRLVTGSADQTARVWDAATGASLLDLAGHTGPIQGTAFSPDGSLIATGSHDRTVRLWDARTGVLRHQLVGHQNRVESVAFSPDGTRVASASDDRTVRFWNCQSGEFLFQIQGHSNHIESLAFSPDGSRLATASVDRTVKVWDSRTGMLLLDLLGHANDVHAVAFSPDGSRLATASRDQLAKIWDARTGALLLDLVGHTAPVWCVTFSPDGARLVTGSEDQTAKVWDSQTGTPVVEAGRHESAVTCVAFSPDGSRLATSSDDRTAKVWDAATGEPLLDLEGHRRWVRAVAFSPDGTLLATGSEDNTARIWNAQTGELVQELRGHEMGITSVAFHPRGSHLATGSTDGTARIWTVPEGKPERVIRGHTNWVTSLAYSPDGSRLVTTSADRTATIWNTETGENLQQLEGHSAIVTSAAFSSDGMRLVTGSDDRTAKVWEVYTGRKVLDLRGHTLEVRCVAFSPEGTRIVTGSNEGTAKVWETQTGAPLLDLRGHTHHYVRGVAFSPDGSRIATAGHNQLARIWEARVGQRRLIIQDPGFSVEKIGFLSDSRELAVRSRDGTQMTLDLHRGTRVNRTTEAEEWDAHNPSLDGRRLVLRKGNWLEVVDLQPDAREREYRLRHFQRRVAMYRTRLQQALQTGDARVAEFFSRLLSAAENPLPSRPAASQSVTVVDYRPQARRFAREAAAAVHDSARQLKGAALLAWFGLDAEYADWCRDALARFAQASDPLVADRIAKGACLVPTDDAQRRTRALELARRALELGQEHGLRHYLVMDLGIAECRTGQFEEALEHLDAAARAAPQDPVIVHTTSLYRALCLFHLGRVEQGRAYLTAVAHSLKPLPEDGAVLFTTKVTENDLILWLACREARELFQPQRPEMPPVPEPPE